MPELGISHFACGSLPRVYEHITTSSTDRLKAELIECMTVRMRLGKPSRENASTVLRTKSLAEFKHLADVLRRIIPGN